MELTFTSRAYKARRKLPKAVQVRIVARLERMIAENPHALDNNVTPLTGTPDSYRLRVGNYRACYTLDFEADEMQVFEVADKKNTRYS